MEEFNFIAIYPNIISFLLIDNFLTVHSHCTYSTYVISLKLLKMFKDTEQKKKNSSFNVSFNVLFTDFHCNESGKNIVVQIYLLDD